MNGIGKNSNKRFIYLLDLYIYMKELKKFVKSLEKYTKSYNSDEKNYLKNLILKERKNNKKISIDELSKRIYYSEKEIQKALDEIDAEETKKITKKQKKPKKSTEFLRKIKQKQLLDKEDKKTLMQIFVKIISFGIPLNLAMFVVTKGFFPFNYYTWIGWGCLLWLIKGQFVDIIRGLYFR